MPQTIHSYRRIFRVDKRVYSVQGRQLPFPGGIPLRILGWIAVAEALIVVLYLQSTVFAVIFALVGALAGWRRGRITGVLAGAVVGWASYVVLGFVFHIVPWEVTFVAIPAAIAGVSIRAEPDGRSPHRYAASWITWQLSPRRWSADGSVPAIDSTHTYRPSCPIAPDWRTPRLHRAEIRGPSTVTFRDPMRVRKLGVGRKDLLARPARRTRRGQTLAIVTLTEGQTMRVLPR